MALADDLRRQRLLSHLNATATMVRSSEHDLTCRQQAVFLKVYLDDAGQTVRGLAKFTGISKPAITRALDRLTEYDLVRRSIDPEDRRSVIVQRTPGGLKYLRRLSEVLVRASVQEIEQP